MQRGDAGPQPGDTILFDKFTSQAVVPTGEKTSRYYYSWGPAARWGGKDMADAMIAVADMAITIFQRQMASLRT